MAEPISRSPSPIEVLKLLVRQHLGEVHTQLPGKIEAIDLAQQTCDVKPLIKRLVALEDGTELLEALPVIPSVPIGFMRSSSFFLSFPLAVGDFVWLQFTERSIDRWYAGAGDDTNPDDFRMHDLSDAVAVPMVYPKARALAEVDTAKVVLGKDGGAQVRIGDIVEAGTAGGTLDFVALAQKVTTQLSTLKSAINGAAVASGDGGAAFKTAILAALAGWPGDVAATKIKAE